MSRGCTEFRCDNAHYAKGLCRNHYAASGRLHKRQEPAPRHIIHMLTCEIEASLNVADIDFLGVAFAAEKIVRECGKHFQPASLSPEKLRELRDRFIVDSLPVQP